MQDRVYDADIYAFGRPPATYWSATGGPAADVAAAPLARDAAVDVAIIGGGYTGLSAARRLTSSHGMSVAVLEAGCRIGWGASGMNGGFVSEGGAKIGTAEMVRRVGEAETRRYWATQTAAVEELRAFIAEHKVDCEPVGDGNLCVAHHPSVVPRLAAEAETLAKRFGVAAEFLPAERFRREVHDGPETYGGLRVRPGFAMHPFRLVTAMGRVTAAGGAALHTGSEVVAWRREGKRHRLATSAGGSVRAGRVVVATNGYAPNELIGAIGFRSVPAISSIVVTQAYGAAELDRRGFHTETPIYNSRGLLSYYRRLPDGRILFGRRGDTEGTAAAAARQADDTLATLKLALPAFADAEIAYSWRGLVCVTARRTLALGLDPDDPSVAYAFGCQGSGTATMTWAGKLAGDLVAGSAGASDVPAIFRGLPPRFPPSNALLRWGLRGAYTVYALRDALHV